MTSEKLSSFFLFSSFSITGGTFSKVLRNIINLYTSCLYYVNTRWNYNED